MIRRSPNALNESGEVALEPVAMTMLLAVTRVWSADRQRMVVQESGMAANALRLGNVLHVAQHEAHKSVAFAPDPIHDLTPVDADSAIDMDAETRCLGDGMGGLGGGNQQLARHAADARAGGAIVAAFDNRDTRTCGFGCAIRGQASRAGTDYCNVN